jgi:hypothetical protein
MRIGVGDGLSLEGYDQFEWRRDRLPGVGSLFSVNDLLDQGGERYLAASDLPTLYRSGDGVPHGIGQYGVALRGTGSELDWGVYALRADARAPVLVLDPANYRYHLDFPRGIDVFGGSLSFYAGNANIAGEISVHRNTPLDATASLSGVTAALAGGGASFYAALRPIAPVAPGPPVPAPAPIALGTTVNAQVSISAQLAPNAVSEGTTLQAEAAGNELVAGDVPAGRTGFAAALRATLTLQYFHVRPGVDVSVPVGLGLGLAGRSSVDGSQSAGAGFVSAGLGATFHVVWQGSLSFTHFVGGAGVQPLADRDFVALSVTRTF